MFGANRFLEGSGPINRPNTSESGLVDFPFDTPVDFMGILADDPTLNELRDEIYRQRDAERDREFPPQST